MNAVDSGLWLTQYQICTRNQNCTAASTISASSRVRQLQRKMDFSMVIRRFEPRTLKWAGPAGVDITQISAQSSSATKFLYHRCSLRPYAAPDEEGFRRLLNQHAQAVPSARTLFAG